MPRCIKAYIYPFQLTARDVLVDGPPTTGNQPFKIDANTMLIWVDLMPDAKFVHPTAYVLISGLNVHVEKGCWWPVLNGQRILYGQNPIVVPSPFDISVEEAGIDLLASLMGDGTLPFGNGMLGSFASYTTARPVFTVDGIELAIIETKPRKLLITALGTTRTSGWKNPRLVPRVYVQPPPDGIWEFDMLADPPTGITLQVITPVFALHLVDVDFSTWKGVRVIAETNAKEKLIGDPKATTDSGHFLVELAR